VPDNTLPRKRLIRPGNNLGYYFCLVAFLGLATALSGCQPKPVLENDARLQKIIPTLTSQCESQKIEPLLSQHYLKSRTVQDAETLCRQIQKRMGTFQDIQQSTGKQLPNFKGQGNLENYEIETGFSKGNATVTLTLIEEETDWKVHTYHLQVK
jgi:hypothetical protein